MNRNAMASPDDGKLPTAADLAAIEPGKIPPRQTQHPAHDVHVGFTPNALAILAEGKVQAFFRKKYDPAALTQAVHAAAQGDALRNRFLQAAALAGQIFDPPALVVEDALRLIMADWKTFEDDFPVEAAQLKDLRDGWQRRHPGHAQGHAAAPVTPTK